jgi:hypothetical protein
MHKMCRPLAAAALLMTATLFCLPDAEAQSEKTKTLRVYHIGNSVTDTIHYGALAKMAESAGRRYIFGRHMIPGAPLAWIWEHPDSGFKEEPFGYYPNALPKFEWDILTLQPFDRHLAGDDGDLMMAKRYIDLALPKSPSLRVYVYSRWPRRDQDGSLDFEKKWLRKYTGGWDGTNETRDYFEQVTHGLRAAYPKLKGRIRLVPVGDVLLALDKKMKAGKVPGHSGIVTVYSDGIHFNDVGAYIVGCTFYATLFRESPLGLPGSPYNVSDAQLARTIQETVWDVVRTHPLSGVATSPERPAPGVKAKVMGKQR